MLNYTTSAKVFQKLNITIKLAAKSLSNWQREWSTFVHTLSSTDILIFLSHCYFNRYRACSVYFGQRVSQELQGVLQFP